MKVFDLNETQRGLPGEIPVWLLLPLTLENVKVFQVNDCDWVAATSAEAAVAWYGQETDTGPHDGIDEPVQECSLDTECWLRVDDHGQGRTTYREIIRDYVSGGGYEPFIVATTEF